MLVDTAPAMGATRTEQPELRHRSPDASCLQQTMRLTCVWSVCGCTDGKSLSWVQHRGVARRAHHWQHRARCRLVRLWLVPPAVRHSAAQSAASARTWEYPPVPLSLTHTCRVWLNAINACTHKNTHIMHTGRQATKTALMCLRCAMALRSGSKMRTLHAGKDIIS